MILLSALQSWGIVAVIFALGASVGFVVGSYVESRARVEAAAMGFRRGLKVGITVSKYQREDANAE